MKFNKINRKSLKFNSSRRKYSSFRYFNKLTINFKLLFEALKDTKNESMLEYCSNFNDRNINILKTPNYFWNDHYSFEEIDNEFHGMDLDEYTFENYSGKNFRSLKSISRRARNES